MSNTIFSVVDIETTGSSQSNYTNRIIQFSCTFVQNNKIIGSFNSFINPEISIPTEITKLTGISNQTVVNAPTFAEVADKIYQLLDKTIFVAHNVNFDFPFLNFEFKRVNHKELTNKAIDTVTLSQLLLPTEPSYKLTDLSKSLNIVHDHPHSSSSDALATAKILIILLHQLDNLPKKTVKQILDINPSLPMDTLIMFTRAYHLKHKDDNPKIMNIKNLKVRKIKYHTDSDFVELKYPNNKRKKSKMFKGVTQFNNTENKLMNSIYGNYHSASNSNNLLIEENREFNYDFSYLFPLSYLLKKNQKIVIAGDEDFNSESALVNQVKNINKITSDRLRCLIVRPVTDYIDLDKFSDSLNVVSNSKNTEFLKCKILVWLTFTKTGDINELKLDKDNNQNYFLNVVSDEQNRGYYIKKLAHDYQSANVILVSHDYLLQNVQKLHQNDPYLVIKDSRRLSDNALDNYRIQFKLSENKIICNHITNLMYQTHNRNVFDIFTNAKKLAGMAKKIENLLAKNTDQFEIIKDDFLNAFYSKSKLNRTVDGYIVKPDVDRFKTFVLNKKSLFNSISRNQQTILDIVDDMKRSINHFNGHDKAILYAFFDKLEEYCSFIENNLVRLFKLNKLDKQLVFAFNVNEDKDVENGLLYGGLVRNENILPNELYRYFKGIIFLDSAIYSSKRSQYFYDKLELKRQNTRMIKFEDENDLNGQVNLILDEALQIPMPLEKVMKYNKGNSFILTRSKQRVKEIAKSLYESDVNEHNVILSQDFSGNDDKIVKKIIVDSQNIIVGNNNLLKSLRNKNKPINTLIIDSMAIDSFDDIYLQAQYDLINSEHGNPNDGLSIPLSILNIKDAIKDVIELSGSKGLIYLRDKEVIEGPYGSNLIDLIPSHIKPQLLDKRKIIEKLKKV
ncbi:3'-5' exonuclease DinG [Apilactobacillus kunkeei]|uniref:exonuclease domain-containing protein n=1 Tax=Apilactobacillus TaxID=2767877 RepID=UPI0022024813|nr:exonuclease domain-containing protein [Apilactobacillus kunkeei]WJV42715.1 exonuclease domain-containing protein [Apilactobacillus kunkeei]CAI2595982.1 3'-5' exonuclease DinG [Apilactobacillus kunkeei]CAI2596162.1 3'-5' exonuclease DinG [Apilactobacillus kunkeei]CAI2596812.1 3'-5' exonuclease DinG [Apilactobacillus kunkeei]CAI2596835.1 3'-5' exonuclease DinG [Apilactobacillus kunkeei]